MDENPKLEMPLEDFAVAVTKENQRLRDILYYSGIVEIAAHNNRVTEYMFHWEGRTLEAEAEVEKMREQNARLHDVAIFLFGVLDDIDTASDEAKNSHEWYRKRVEHLHRKRFEVMETDGYTVKVKI